MCVSGEKRSNVIVKMNGRFWGQESDKRKDAKRNEPGAAKVPGKRTPIPFPPQHLLKNSNDAWDRMMELRGRAERETTREPVYHSGAVPEDGGDYPANVHEERAFSKKPVNRLFSSWSQGPVFRTVLTTGGAIAIGLLFGFLVLTVFSEKELSQSYRHVLNDTVQTLTAQNATGTQAGTQLPVAGPVLPGMELPMAETPAASAAAVSSDVDVQLPEVKMYVAQAGVFQPDTAPQAAVEPLDKLGLPHLLYKNKANQYVFAAAAPTRDAVLGFASSLKSKGVDVYVKEFSFPAYQGRVAVTAAADSGSAKPDWNAFFANGMKLAQTLSAQSGQVIASAQPALSQEEAAEMKEQHRQFLEEGRLVQSQAEKTPYVSQMVSGINQAMDARGKMAEANQGKKAKSAESYAWQVQAGVLKYLENYAAWVQQSQKAE
ncbi:hypothetical protein ACFSO0_07880 [Brevibacillus sp. GCM10020057]|uniref:hypothetical protein n=1 Tax=Brevibacillus sp. GCM10020057 TaxID=3317327 RepID=UPI00363C5379